MTAMTVGPGDGAWRVDDLATLPGHVTGVVEANLDRPFPVTVSAAHLLGVTG